MLNDLHIVDQAFSASYDLAPPPPSSRVVSLSEAPLCVAGRAEWWRSKIIRWRESLVLFVLFNNF
jgi:hypothetical protein